MAPSAAGHKQTTRVPSPDLRLPIRKLQSHRVLSLKSPNPSPCSPGTGFRPGRTSQGSPAAPSGGGADLLFHVPRSPACLEASFQTFGALVKGKGDDEKLKQPTAAWSNASERVRGKGERHPSQAHS